MMARKSRKGDTSVKRLIVVVVVLAALIGVVVTGFAQNEKDKKGPRWGQSKKQVQAAPSVRTEKASPWGRAITERRNQSVQDEKRVITEKPSLWGQRRETKRSPQVKAPEMPFRPVEASRPRIQIRPDEGPKIKRAPIRRIEEGAKKPPFIPRVIQTRPRVQLEIPSPTIEHRRIPSGKIAGTRVIDRTSIRQLRPSYDQVVRHFGRPPAHRFAFEPRRIYTRGFRQSHFRDRVSLSFYFGYYHSEPEWVGLYHRGYYPAVYVLWGWCPGWILPARVHYTVFDYLDRRPAPRDYRGVDRAVDDLQTAWTDGDLELIDNYLTDDVKVRIYFNGKYSYSLAIEDFRQMTADALASTKTTAIRFNQPIWLAPREVFISGHQLFLDPEGGEHQMYISYRLRRLGSSWYIVAFGSSDEPIVSYRR